MQLTKEMKNQITKFNTAGFWIIALSIFLTAQSSFSVHGLDRRPAGGASDGGGGGVVIQNGQYILTDFFNLQSLPPRLNEKPGSLDAQEALIDGKRISHAWINLPLDLIGNRLLSALNKNMMWRLTEDPLTPPPFYRPDFLPAQAQIIPAAHYQMNGKDIWITLNRPIWNRLSAKNQTALILHEAFRQVQIGYGVEFSDETLQKATVIFMTCKPSVKLSQYMNLLALNLTVEASQRFGSFQELTQNCGDLQ